MQRVDCLQILSVVYHATQLFFADPMLASLKPVFVEGTPPVYSIVTVMVTTPSFMHGASFVIN